MRHMEGAKPLALQGRQKPSDAILNSVVPHQPLPRPARTLVQQYFDTATANIRLKNLIQIPTSSFSNIKPIHNETQRNLPNRTTENSK